MPVYFFAHSILKQSREYFVYLCLKYQCCMNHSPVLCFLSLFPAGNLLSSYSANYTGNFTTTIHLDQSGDQLSPIYFKTKTTLYIRLFFPNEMHFLVFSTSFSELKPGIFLWTQSTTAGQKTQTLRTQRHSILVKVRIAIWK